MNRVWHLLKYSFIFHQVKFAFLSFTVVLIFFISHKISNDLKEAGEFILQYCGYLLFFQITMKTAAKNSMQFDIKHMCAMPISKKEIVYTKSLADCVQVLPVILGVVYGAKNAYPEFNVVMLFIFAVILTTIGNIVAFNNRIDFSRMQHSKTSFKNSILFLHKYLELFIHLFITAVVVGIVYVRFKDSNFLLQYGFIIIGITGIFLIGATALKMLKDETRSYFVFRRDSIRIGWKLLVVGVPLLSVSTMDQENKIFKQLMNTNQNFEQFVLTNTLDLKDPNKKEFVQIIAKKDNTKLEEYFKTSEKIPWNFEVMGNYIPHLLVHAKNREGFALLAKYHKDKIDIPGKNTRRTALFTALGECDLEFVKLIVSHGANINSLDNKGNTPAHFAAQKKCYGGVVLLKSYGADFKLQNDDKKFVSDYIPKRYGINELIGEKASSKRDIASEPKLKPTLRMLPELQQLKQLRQQE